jgi:sentrin-specific protease 8
LIINYHDAVIYGSDLKLLKNRTEWLNDSCIHFFFVLLQQRQRQSEQEREREQKDKEKKEGKGTSSSSSSSFLFMDPSVVSYWMHQCTDQDDIKDFVNNTNFPKPKGRNGNGGGGVIFIAVNDDMALSSNGWQIPNSGSHWSLLLIIVGCGDDNNNNNDDDDSEVGHSSLRFLHFDSIRNSRNIRAAEDIAKKIMLHVYSDDNNKRKRDSDSNSDKPKVIQVETPQQLNGYDCGVHVLGAAKILSSTTASLIFYSNNYNNSDSMNSSRLNSLEESLRQGVGNNSFDFCSKLRDEISSEILRLSSSSS